MYSKKIKVDESSLEEKNEKLDDIMQELTNKIALNFCSRTIYYVCENCQNEKHKDVIALLFFWVLLGISITLFSLYYAQWY